MSLIENLTWSDIESDTMNPNEYLNKFSDKPTISRNYSEYSPIVEILEKIEEILTENNENLRILVIGAEWCPDCSRNTPKMIKIIKNLSVSDIQFKILFGVKVNAMRKKGDIYWHKVHSPPEATDPKFDLKAIPIFYVFNKNGNYLDRIVEKPTLTLEEDLLAIIRKKLAL